MTIESLNNALRLALEKIQQLEKELTELKSYLNADHYKTCNKELRAQLAKRNL